MKRNPFELTIALIKIHFQRSGEVERAVITAALSILLFSYGMKVELFTCSNCWDRAEKDTRRMNLNTAPCKEGAKSPVMGPLLPQSLCAHQSAQSQAQSKGKHRRQFLPHGWENLCWKEFSEVSPSSLYMQVLCLTISSIRWQIHCLADNSPLLLHHWESPLCKALPWNQHSFITSQKRHFLHTQQFPDYSGLSKKRDKHTMLCREGRSWFTPLLLPWDFQDGARRRRI